MKDHLITINSFELKSKVKIDRLTKLQKLICKLFRITPEVLYDFVIEISTEGVHPIMAGDMVLTQDETKWMVLNVSKELITMRNIVLCQSFNIRKGDVMIIYRNSWCEGNGSPTSKY